MCKYLGSNKATVADRNPIMHVRYFSNKPCRKYILSSFGLLRTHYRVLLAPKDIPKIGITSFGPYEILRMHFAPKNAAQTYYWFMDPVLLLPSCMRQDMSIDTPKRALDAPLTEHFNFRQILLSKWTECFHFATAPSAFIKQIAQVLQRWDSQNSNADTQWSFNRISRSCSSRRWR